MKNLIRALIAYPSDFEDGNTCLAIYSMDELPKWQVKRRSIRTILPLRQLEDVLGALRY